MSWDGTQEQKGWQVQRPWGGGKCRDFTSLFKVCSHFHGCVSFLWLLYQVLIQKVA